MYHIDNITIFSCSVDKDIVLHIFLKILYIILKIFDTRLYKSVEDIWRTKQINYQTLFSIGFKIVLIRTNVDCIEELI